MRIKRLNESYNDGWNIDYLYGVKHILDDLNNINYEIDNCVRGAYSHAETYEELSYKLQDLANSLIDAAEDIADIVDEDDEDLHEDTVKLQNGKWANIGKEGKHGEFNTKKEADAQRRAMFVNK